MDKLLLLKSSKDDCFSCDHMSHFFLNLGDVDSIWFILLSVWVAGKHDSYSWYFPDQTTRQTRGINIKVFNLLKVSLLKIYLWLAYHPEAQQKGDLQYVRLMHQAPRCHLDHPMKYPPHWTLVNDAFKLHNLPCLFVMWSSSI